MRNQTYYEILEVDQQAPAAQIKSNYRRLAKRYHPDLNPNNVQAAQRFREVQTAYDVLSDAEKRQQYDQTITTHTPQSQAQPNGQRAYRYYDGRVRTRPRTRPVTNRPVNRPYQPRSAYSRYTVDLTLPELFKGARRFLTIGETFTCGRCRGRGRLESGVKCERCDGYGFVVSYKRVEVLIPPGLQPDMTIRLDVNGAEPEHPLLDSPVMTDICVTVRLRENHLFHYRENQLYTQAEVPAQLLEVGGEWTIPAPEGGEFTFKIPANTPSGTVLTIRKRGLRSGASHRRGNLFCTVVAS